MNQLAGGLTRAEDRTDRTGRTGHADSEVGSQDGVSESPGSAQQFSRDNDLSPLSSAQLSPPSAAVALTTTFFPGKLVLRAGAAAAAAILQA